MPTTALKGLTARAVPITNSKSAFASKLGLNNNYMNFFGNDSPKNTMFGLTGWFLSLQEAPLQYKTLPSEIAF